MKRTQTVNLHFEKARSSVSAIELDLDSLPDGEGGYGAAVSRALTEWAASRPDCIETIYVHVSNSQSFQRPTRSATFTAVAGSDALEAIESGLRTIPGIAVLAAEGRPTPSFERCYHVEDGSLWEPDGGAHWTEWQNAAESELESNEEAFSDSNTSAPDPHRVAQARLRAKQRVLRGDATVGRVRARLERQYGLPEGSIQLCGPDGKPLRADARIQTLRQRWEA